MRSFRIILALSMVFGFLAASASAHMGDSVTQSLFRYGQPVASHDASPGLVTSTKTFNVSGLIIVCGYLDGKVVMETLTKPSRDFLPAEVEALLRSEGRHLNWTPPGPYAGTMTYKRADGATAQLTGNKLEIIAPAWTTALARDAATQKAIASGQTNIAPTPEHPTADTSASATPLEALDPPVKHAGTVTTNAAP